jgi:hypothetical protein
MNEPRLSAKSIALTCPSLSPYIALGRSEPCGSLRSGTIPNVGWARRITMRAGRFFRAMKGRQGGMHQ